MTRRKEHRFINSALTAALPTLLLIGLCFQSAAHPAAKGTAAHKSDLHALTRITGIVRYYSPNPYTAGTEAEVRAEVIDSILIFNPSLTMECYEEFLPYLDSIIAGEYRAVAFDLREYPALDFDRVLAHLTDSALNTAPLFHTPLSCFPDRMHLRWDSHDDFVRPAAPRIDLPVYFLCGPKSMSWCETVLMLVKGYGLGTVIGSSTTGTNGDASTFPLPAFPFRMTAVKAVNLDGSRHHGTGVQPDIPAEIGGYEDAVRIIEDFQRQ